MISFHSLFNIFIHFHVLCSHGDVSSMAESDFSNCLNNSSNDLLFGFWGSSFSVPVSGKFLISCSKPSSSSVVDDGDEGSARIFF